jgi:hypothetical protein
MYAFANESGPVADYERMALVKEYVWRTRGCEDPALGANDRSQNEPSLMQNPSQMIKSSSWLH